jgi:hypothetical protein
MRCNRRHGGGFLLSPPQYAKADPAIVIMLGNVHRACHLETSTT